jgi:hypothetical protein
LIVFVLFGLHQARKPEGELILFANDDLVKFLETSTSAAARAGQTPVMSRPSAI